jgi:hypothetical protein
MIWRKFCATSLRSSKELQKFDAQIQELTGALQAIPAKLDATKNDLARSRGC